MEIRFQPYRKSGTWVVYWKSPWTGAHHHRGFYTQEEAENFVKGLSDIYNKEKEIIRRRKRYTNTKILLSDLVERYFSVAVTNMTTLKQNRYHITHIVKMFGNRQAIKITMDDILYFIEVQRLRGLRQTTINIRVSILRTIMNWGVRVGLLPHNPLSSFRLPQARPQRIVPPTPDELQRIYAVSPDHIQRIILLGTYLGPRIGPSELFKLRWSDVDLKNGIIHMPNAAKGATDSARVIPIRSGLIPILSKLFNSDRILNISFVIHWKGNSVRSIHRAWTSALKRAGIERRITPYCLRHAYATYSVQGGAKLKPLAKLMGHKNERMILQTYQHVLEKDERDTIEAMPDVLRLFPKRRRPQTRKSAPVPPYLFQNAVKSFTFFAYIE